MIENNGTDIEQPTKRTPPLTIGTHSGTFHCDEVLACFMLRQLPEYEFSRIFRSRDTKELHKECDIIVDVGGEFDHERRLYDHHQNSFQSTLSSLRPELGDEFKIRLSSAGLVYCYFGERIIAAILKKRYNMFLSPDDLRLAYVQIYKGLICEIDAIDNGVPLIASGLEPQYKISTHISARIGRLNPSWDEENSADIQQERFEKAMMTCGQEFEEKVLNICGSWIKARKYVRNALQTAKAIYATGEILLLERFCPWKWHLADLEKEYEVEGVPKVVVFEDSDKSWRVAGVPANPDSFLGRKFLPIPWRGLRDDELSKVAAIPNLKFVHHTGFIGGALSKESAIAMAVKSVEWSGE